MKLHHRILPAALASLAVLLLASAPARAELLSDLIDLDGSIQLGDKVFSDFDYTFTGDMPSATGVNVDAIFDLNGDVTLRFQGGFVDNPGGGASDALIMYTVSATDPGQLISNVSMSANLALNGNAGGFINISEFFPNQASQLLVFAGPGGTQLSDSSDVLPPLSTLVVQKDIFADAGAAGNPVNVSVINQTFQQVPEPMSMALAALAGLGAVGLIRRRRTLR